jgi:SIR2-like domain
MYADKDHQAFEQLKRALSGGLRASVLVGAGISVSSGVPTAYGIIRRLKRLGKIKAFTSYAEAMEAAFKNQAERREFINRTFEGCPPSIEHHQLGRLLSSRVFKDALTTNFDHLLEIATSQACEEPVFVYPTQRALEGFQTVEQSPRIVKLHGDFLFQSLANTDAEMGGVGTGGMYQALKNMTLNTSLVVLGYAGDSSVLKLLEDLAARSERCIPSIWWFFHNPPGLNLDQDPLKAAEYRRVSDFLAKLEKAGRKTALLRNVHGLKWVFEELGKHADVNLTKPTFGIGSNRYIAPYRAWGSSSVTQTEPPQVLLPYLGQLEKLLLNPGLVVLQGRTQSGKSTILKTLQCRSELPIFYFSFVHVRNSPEDHSFLSDLHDFLGRRKILTEANEQTVWLETLFDVGGILVLDDLPVTFDLTRRSASVGALRQSLLHVLVPALRLIAEKRKGKVILALPDVLRDSDREFLYQIIKSFSGLQIAELQIGGQEEPTTLKAYKRLPGPLKNIVNGMLWLRFAEPPEVIAKLSKQDAPVLDELSNLISAGFVSECFGTYVLRVEFRSLLTHYVLNTWTTQRLVTSVQSFIDVLNEEADDPEQIYPRHYLLELENACFTSTAGFGTELWRTGVKTLATMTRAFLSDKLNTEFFLSTLSGFHQLVGKRVFQFCDLVDLTTLYSLFSDASRTEKFPALTRTFWTEVEGRGPGVGSWLSARRTLEKRAYLDKPAVAKLLRAISRLHRDVAPSSATADDWHLLGSMHLTIGKAALAQASQHLSRSSMRRALKHAHAAYRCFKQSCRQDSVDDAERQLGNIHMAFGLLQAARRYFISLLRRERKLPGFEPVKAASLHNIFCISLGLGDMRRAEGFFWEANYQYAHTTQAMSFLALAVLAATKTSPLPWIRVASSLEFLDQLPAAYLIAEKAALIAPSVSRGAREDVLFRTTDSFGKVAGTLYEKGQMVEARTVVRSVLTMLDEALPGSSHSFDDGLISNLAKSITRYVPVGFDEFASIAFVEGLSNTTLKEVLRDHLSPHLAPANPIEGTVIPS